MSSGTSKKRRRSLSTFSDMVAGNSELDAVRSVNAKKGFARGFDSAPESKPEETDQKAPAVTKGSDSAAQDIFPDDGTLSLTKEQLKALVDAGVSSQMKDIRHQVAQAEKEIEQTKADKDAALAKAEDEKLALERRLEAERKQRDTLSKVFTEFGYSVPSAEDGSSNTYIAPLNLRGGISADDSRREFERIYSDRLATPAISVFSHDTGETNIHRDTRTLLRFIKENRDRLRDGMEQYAKKHGMLRGGQSYSGKDDPTTIASIPPAFMQYLSLVTRIEHSAQFVLWQFPNRMVSAGIPPGQTAVIPRVLHLASGTASSDWRLTPGVPIGAGSQALQANGRKVEIFENGMGKDSTMSPVVVPDFLMAYSLIDLENKLRERLGYNYHLFEDISIREMLFKTTRVVYNAKGDVTTDPTQLTAGSGAQLSRNFLGSLRAYMSSLYIPKYEDGCYVYIAPPNQIAQLEKDLSANHQYYDKGNVEELTNMLVRKTQNADMMRVSGYVGKVSGFHIFEANSFSVGAPGAPGVQTESIGGAASAITTSGFGLGADATGWSTAMPMEIREDNDNNFGRLRRFVWKSHEGWNALDVDPASEMPDSADQQLRVIETRMSNIEV